MFTSPPAISGHAVEASSYNGRNQPNGTTTSIPAAEGALAGTYTTTNAYTANVGLLDSTAYPAEGGLAAETVYRSYTALDLPVATAGSHDYISSTSYTAFGEPLRYSLGFSTNIAYVKNTYDDHTRRLANQITDRATAPARVDELDYTYDPAGNITRTSDVRSLMGAGSTDTQCYHHDVLGRMDRAWTATDSCVADAQANSGATVGGPDAYWTDWQFDVLGNRTSQTEHAIGGASVDTVSNYTYDGNGKNQPDTLTKVVATGPGGVSTQKFTYDKSGSVGTRLNGGVTQTFTFDAEHHLALVVQPAGSTALITDADGNPLLRRGPGLSTLYLPDTELVVTTGPPVGTRYYRQGAAPVGVRTGSAFSFLVGNQQGTHTLTLDGTAQVASYRDFTPYGAARSSGVWPEAHGFLDKSVDVSLGLNMLGARQYDPMLGRFLSVDPVLSPGDPQSLAGYAYANNNPVTFSDPSGLQLTDCNSACYAKLAKARSKYTVPLSKTFIGPRLAAYPDPPTTFLDCGGNIHCAIAGGKISRLPKSGDYIFHPKPGQYLSNPKSISRQSGDPVDKYNDVWQWDPEKGEWDVQHQDKSHTNVSPEGEVTHKPNRSGRKDTSGGDGDESSDSRTAESIGVAAGGAIGLGGVLWWAAKPLAVLCGPAFPVCVVVA